MPRVAIFDYGAGNIFSLKNALERQGAQAEIITDLEDSKRFSGLLLPGVGNFDPAARSMKTDSGIPLGERIGPSIPVLGICLGMEIYFERSQEGKEPGFGAMGGEVVSLPDTIKVPHMGWNSLDACGDSKLLAGIGGDNVWAYFVHSYCASPSDPGVVAATADYGTRIPAVIESGRLYGTQFHPEKSGKTGGMMISNFLRECQR